LKTLSAIDISKTFGGIAALDKASISISTGKITGLIGENGAGKSTIIKILNGIYKLDSGHIEVEGKKFSDWNSKQAKKTGISTIHQEILLVPELNVYQNVTLGQPQTKHSKVPKIFQNIDVKKDEKFAIEFLQNLGVQEDFRNIKAGSLSPGKAQLVLIARAISQKSDFLILDEPTAALPQNERIKFFEIINLLAKNGKGILLVSHHLEEVEKMCSEVYVLRDGKNTAKLTGPEINIKNMVNNMLARELTEQYQRPQNIPKAEIMIEVDQISSLPLLNNVSFKIKKGEILGIVGLLGSGKTELARALIGINKNSGTIKVQGKVVKNLKVIDALKAGIILVPEERKSQAILPDLNVFYNGIVTYANINYYDKYWKIFKNNTLKAKVESILKELSVKYTNLNRITKGLSGGNQQKLVIGRVLLCNPKLLILDEPTRGIDVGSKSDVYSIIQNAVKNDLTVLIMSGELEEMAVICHRILVLSNGEILGEFNPQKSSTDEIKELMGGLNQERKRENV
jgi:ABC-type sugar transport system ATPase subunit